MDLQKTVSAEKITGVSTIPTGACTGELIESDPNDWKNVKCGEDTGSAPTPSSASRAARAPSSNMNSGRVVAAAVVVAMAVLTAYGVS